MPKKNKQKTIYIFGIIGYEYTSKMMFQQLEEADQQGITDINILINSPGGDVFEGLAIYNMLLSRSVQIEITGQASSIASVIAMAGKSVVINSNSYMMIHNPGTGGFGDDDYMQKVTDDLAQLKTTMIEAYSNKTGLDKKELAKMMKAETLMSADVVVEKGFADSKIENSIKNEAMNYMNYYKMVTQTKKENRMWEKIKALFGFGDDVTEDQAIEKIKALKETVIENKVVAPVTPDVPAVVPAAENKVLNQINQTVQNLQTKIDSMESKSQEDKVENLVTTAINDGKILPADKDIYIAAAEKSFDNTQTKLDAIAKNAAMPGKVETPENQNNDKPVSRNQKVANAISFLKENWEKK